MSDIGSEGASRAASVSVPMWGKALVVAAIGLMGVGVVVPLVMPTPEPVATSSSSASGGSDLSGVTGFAGPGEPQTGGAAPVEPEPTGLAAWSPTIFSLGFSFFVGFAIAYALRMFLRLALIGAGFFFMLMFGLQYAGLVEVKWAAMEDKYDAVTSQLDDQAHSATDYITTYLPSAGSASAGLFAGFWRRRVL